VSSKSSQQGTKKGGFIRWLKRDHFKKRKRLRQLERLARQVNRRRLK